MNGQPVRPELVQGTPERKAFTMVEKARRPLPALTGDSMVLALLTLFNESNDADTVAQQCLELIADVCGACAGEIWLLADRGCPAELRYSTSCAELNTAVVPAVVPSTAASRLVARVVKTGKAATASRAAGVSLGCAGGDSGSSPHAVSGLPIRAGGDIVGALALVYDSARPPGREAVSAAAAACRHLGEFLTRARAERVLHERARALSELASTDSLTGLKNRREFDRALRTIPRQPFAVLSIDVDHLKETNDRHGHAAGDALLRLVGNTLGLMVRGWDVMARVGGDEFAALLPGVGVFGAALVAERMREAMHVLELATGPVRITAGWSAAPAGADPVSVWRVADECLYKAKAAGRDAVHGRSYHGGVESADIAERSYSDVVTLLLEGGALHTVFQPIVNLNDGSVVGYESLARPEGFAPLDSVEAVFEAARNGGQIRDVDWLCRRRAVEDARSLPEATLLFLNMSAAALMDPRHGVDQLLQALRVVGRAPGKRRHRDHRA